MPEKKFNQVLDRYLLEGSVDCEEYEELNEMQTYTIQSIKRAKKRILAKTLKWNTQ